MGHASAAALIRAGGIVFAPPVRYGGSRGRVDNRDRARDRAGTGRRTSAGARRLAAAAPWPRTPGEPGPARVFRPARGIDRALTGAARFAALARAALDDCFAGSAPAPSTPLVRRDLQWRRRCVGRGRLEHQLRLRARARRHAVGGPAAGRGERRVRVRSSCAVPREARDRGRRAGGRRARGGHRDAAGPRQLRDVAHSRRGRRAGALAAAARRVHAGRGGRRAASRPGARGRRSAARRPGAGSRSRRR